MPQLLGTYLAVGFGVLQFVEFISRRFSLADFWVDGYLLLWLLLIPAVSLLLYYRGLPPKGTKLVAGWKRWAVYGNILIAVLALLFVPKGKGAPVSATETISTTDEAGNDVQRIIPAASAIQRIGLFEFENAGGTAAADWLGTAFPLLLQDGLHQRPELIVSGVRTLNRYYNKYGVEPFSKINLATQWKIAKRANTDYFVRAEFKAVDGSYEITGDMHQTNNGKQVKTLRALADNPFSAVDELKKQIFDFLPPPVVSDQQMTDLPVSALITDNMEALEAYTLGIKKFSQNPGDLPPVADYFRKSVAADPLCATCLYELADKLYGMGKVDSALTYITKATKLAEMLPEREQFGFKSTYFTVTRNIEGYLGVMEKVRQLYPYEYYPYASLVGYYQTTYGTDSAIALMETAALISDREMALAKLYELNVSAKNYDRAEEIIRTLDKELAEPEETQRRYASFYQKTGQLDKARATLKEMIASDPLDVDLTAQLASIEVTAGNYDQAEKLAKEIFRRATTRADTTVGWNNLIQAYFGRGEIRLALQELTAYEKYISKDSPINVILANNLNTKVVYALRLKEPLPLIESFYQEMGRYNRETVDFYRCYLNVQFALAQRNLPGIADKITDCEEALSVYGPALIQVTELAKLVLAGDYEVAAGIIEKQLADKTERLGPEAYLPIFRLAGKTDRALDLLAEARETRPNDPVLQLEHARLMLIKGDKESAKTDVSAVLKTLNKADADHFLRAEAEVLAAKLGMNQ